MYLFMEQTVVILITSLYHYGSVIELFFIWIVYSKCERNF